MLQSFIIFALLLNFAYTKRELSLFTYYDYEEGSSLTILTNVSNLPEFATGIIPNVQRLCHKGLWITYSGVNYTGTPLVHPPSEYWTGTTCSHVDIISNPLGSVRYVGLDADISNGLTIFSDVNFEGDEFQIIKPANAHLPFDPKSFLISGSNEVWTFYSGTNFNGSSMCYSPSYYGTAYMKVHVITDIGSIAYGCHNNFV